MLFELGGSPVFADGKITENGDLQFEPNDFGPWLETDARRMINRQFGSIKQWGARVQEGLIGAANAIVIDNEETYFTPASVCGQLVFEDRTPERHIVSADARAFYTPRYDLTRATRAVAVTRNGPCWIIDELQAATPHAWTWQVYLRQGAELDGHQLKLRTSDGKLLTMVWLPADQTQLETIADFPAAASKSGLCWPENGSERLRLRQTASRTARFVVCLLPNIHTVARVTAVAELSWRVEWNGGEQTFSLPPAALESRDSTPLPPSTWCDLDEPPYPAPSAVADRPLDWLRAPQVEDWRSTIEAMQSLTTEQEAEGLPLIHRLMMDADQRYQVHSVAAWRLGRSRYTAAKDDLRQCSHAAEPNLARRAAWALDKIETGVV